MFIKHPNFSTISLDVVRPKTYLDFWSYIWYYICQVEGTQPESKGCPREQVSRSRWSHRKELCHFAVYKCEPEPLDGMEYGEYGGWMTRQLNRWTNVCQSARAKWNPFSKKIENNFCLFGIFSKILFGRSTSKYIYWHSHKNNI